MQVSINDAKSKLIDLVRRAEAGDEIILTRNGQPTVRLAPITTLSDRAGRRKVMKAVRRAGVAKAAKGPSAARSQDFLYGADGLTRP